MKKLALTIAIVLGMTLGVSAQMSQQTSGGLFERGHATNELYYGFGSSNYDNLFGNLRGGLFPGMPFHGETDSQNADTSPLGSGIAVLLGLGAAYAAAKKRKED